MNEKTYTTFQIAEICGVRPTTIISWINRKKIKAFVTLGGHRRVLESDLVAFLKKNEIPVPKELLKKENRILVVEDDASVGHLLLSALRKIPNVSVEWTQDGIEALLALGKCPPDLMVLDVVMPVVDGAKVLATLRSDPKTKKINVIGITGEHLTSEKYKYMQANTDAFFMKPFNVGQLVKKASNLLDIELPTPNPLSPKAQAKLVRF